MLQLQVEEVVSRDFSVTRHYGSFIVTVVIGFGLFLKWPLWFCLLKWKVTAPLVALRRLLLLLARGRGARIILIVTQTSRILAKHVHAHRKLTRPSHQLSDVFNALLGSLEDHLVGRRYLAAVVLLLLILHRCHLMLILLDGLIAACLL